MKILLCFSLFFFNLFLISLEEAVRRFVIMRPFENHVRDPATFGLNPSSRKTHTEVGLLKAFGHDGGSPQVPAVMPGTAQTA